MARSWREQGNRRAYRVRVGGAFLIRSTAPDGALHTIDGTYRELSNGQRVVMTWSYSGPRRAVV